jgi:ATP-dependent RNA helicase DDX3X
LINGKAAPFALVLAPTRELAIQIQDECKKFSAGTRIKTCILYGGAPIRNQLRDLERGTDVLIATPGRLTDVIDRGKVTMERIQYLVLDEAGAT